MELLLLIATLGLLSLFDFGGGDDDDSGKEINGSSGKDTLEGTSGDDTISGGKGFDDILAGAGDDKAFGGLGKDLLVGGAGADDLHGDNWNDGLFGGSGNDNLYGGSSQDLLVGGSGNDLLDGGSGDDALMDRSGSDVLYGGDGDDLLVASDIFTRDLTPADYDGLRDDTLERDEDGDVIFAGLGLKDGSNSDGADTLFGGAGDDVLFLGNDDVATGGAGMDDFLVGDWIADSGSAALITDFNSSEDLVVISLSDDNADAEIDIIEDGEAREIQVNGVTVARVEGTFDSLDGFAADVITATHSTA